ncbi:hypothetical protein GCM10009544_16040 [Streptomyces stramineus]|uniref:Uncharacterized protein n=1 Tax=Streptomyces stramineus TaxID=173861 RepID=A0ABN0ZNU7_9ACTN
MPESARKVPTPLDVASSRRRVQLVAEFANAVSRGDEWAANAAFAGAIAYDLEHPGAGARAAINAVRAGAGRAV